MFGGDSSELSARLTANARVSNAKLTQFLGRELLVPSYREGAQRELESMTLEFL